MKNSMNGFSKVKFIRYLRIEGNSHAQEFGDYLMYIKRDEMKPH